MKVKIGDKIYTTDKDGPIMVILTEKDKFNISHMAPDATRYCQWQEENHTPEEISKWMDEGVPKDVTTN